MKILTIEPGSPAYEQECDLRQRVLRAPLGLDLHDENLEMERAQSHHGLFDGDVLIACVIAVPLSPGEMKFRQMAVDSSRQGQGCGRLLLEMVEAEWAARGVARFVLHARLIVGGFYEKLGYARVCQIFTEVGIPHVKMIKEAGGL